MTDPDFLIAVVFEIVAVMAASVAFFLWKARRDSARQKMSKRSLGGKAPEGDLGGKTPKGL